MSILNKYRKKCPLSIIKSINFSWKSKEFYRQLDVRIFKKFKLLSIMSRARIKCCKNNYKECQKMHKKFNFSNK